jgi:hypothetical protein
MADITNVKLGACSVKFDDVDLGHTKGGVTMNYEPEYYDITVDKYGNTPAEKVLVGESWKITVPLAEATLANLGIAIPGATEVGSPVDSLTIGRVAGERMAQYAASLVIHPLANAADDRSEDVVIYKAIVAEPIEHKFSNEGERIIEVVFQAIIDETKSDGSYLGLIGDSD